MTVFRGAIAGLAFVAGLASAFAASAQSADAYPTRPVTIVVPFPAGGSADLNARTVAERLSAALGQPFIVDNKAGASGNVGTAFASKAPPDGYTLLMSNSGALTVNPHIFAAGRLRSAQGLRADLALGMKISNLLLVHPEPSGAHAAGADRLREGQARHVLRPQQRLQAAFRRGLPRSRPASTCRRSPTRAARR